MPDPVRRRGSRRRKRSRREELSVSPVLGDFRVLRLIGYGACRADVYLAEQVSRRRLVALRVLHARLAQRPEEVEGFRREATAASRLRHPGIIEVLAPGEDAGTHYFAMELVRGADLRELILALSSQDPPSLTGEHVGVAVARAARRLALAPSVAGEETAEEPSLSCAWNQPYIETVCRLVAEVANALEHVHTAGIVHGLVMPSNILVRQNGSAALDVFRAPHELDLDPETVAPPLAYAAMVFYFSPEQLMARGTPGDHRTDIYSLGVTLYEMLTLHRPFAGDSRYEVLRKIVMEEAPDPRRFNALLPEDLVTIVRKSIEKDRDRRYSSAGAMAADLRAFLEGRPIAARRRSAWSRICAWVRRERT
ncbi:MAG: serine/threonine protein kinase [Planctomycetes bacterium]|nr:serine/threonine protein kinase [Planctomycetota bacterium]